MPTETTSLSPVGDVMVPETLRREVLEATNEARFWDAYQLALTAGPLEHWSDPEAKLLAGRLGRHLGGSKLYWRLTAQAWRERRNSTRFSMQRVYAIMERWGIFPAWEASRHLEQCEATTDEERADALVCRGICHVVFRDFETAQGFFSEAQALAPESAWVWSESSAVAAEQGEHEAALEFVNHALELKPYFRSALQRKANYLQSVRRDEEAEELLEAGRRHLQSGAVINQLIVIRSEQEEWGPMLELLDEAERLSPLADEGLRSWLAARRADALVGLGELAEAGRIARSVTKVKFYEKLAERLESTTEVGRRVKIPVPFIQQDYNTCAPATLSAITTYWGNPIAQDTLIGEICYDGTYDFVERRWAEQAGWHVREFKVTWDAAVALLDRGIPFILTTQEINSGHSQAVMGYDTVRRSLLLRDPSIRHFSETGYEEFEKHYAPVGPRGFLLLWPEHAEAVGDLTLPEADWYDLTYAINRALEAHDRARAQEILQTLSDQEPNHRLTWMGKRALAHYDQNPQAHLEAVDGLLRLFPEDDRLLNIRLQLLRALGRGHEASELLRTRCQREDAPYQFRRERGRELRQEKNRTEAALRQMRWALKSGPCDLDNLTALADILWDGLRRQEALAIQHVAVCIGEKKEGIAEAYVQMQEACGQGEAGIDFLRSRATTLLGKSSAPTITLANALDRQNRAAEVRQVLEEALAQRPNDGDLHLRLAQFEAACGHLDQSRELLERAQAKTRPVAWWRAAAHLERLLGNFDQALGHWQKLVELSPIDLEAHRQIAWLLARRSGKAAAQDYVRALGHQFPFHRGLLEIELGWLKHDFPEEAEQRITTYLVTNPTDAWARRERALSLQNRRALEEALAEAEEARQFEPHQAPSWQIEASVLESLNRTDEAREKIKRALELNIDSVYAIRRLVFLSDTMPDKLEALRYIREQFDRQSFSGPAIPVYREVAFPILEMADLTTDLQTIQRQRPDLWESWHTLLQQLIAVGRLEEAGQIAGGATERFPTLPVIWRDAARLNQRTNAWPEAAACLLHALRINPDWAPLVCDLAGVYRREAKMAEARELLERSHQRNPLDATVLGTLADLLWHMGERETALNQVRKSVEINPDYTWGWNTLAHWSELLHKRNMALEMARERAERLGRDAAAWLLVSRLAQRPELAGERLAAALRARECEPRNVDAHDASVLALAEQRRYEEAIAACHPAVFGARAPVWLRGREAWLLTQQGKPNDAMDKMKEVVTGDPDYLWGWDRLSDWYFSVNRFADSLNASEKVVRLMPLEAQSYGKRARALAKLTKPKEAKLDFQKALALDPADGFAGWQLFQMQLAERDFAGAAATIASMRAHTSPGVILPAEIVLACKQSKWDEALTLLKQTALLLEVDTGAAKAALEALDAGKQGKKVNKLLTSLISNPDLNPYLASVWADRTNLVTRWNLFSYLKKIPGNSRSLESVLQNVVLGSKKVRHPVQLVKKLIGRYPKATRKHTQVWAVIGQILTSGSSWSSAANWLKDWESRPDAQGWMVTNLVFSLQVTGRTKAADAVSEKLLTKGLRDHTTAYHLIYLALSALERHETEKAHDLLQGVHLESKHKHDEFFKLAVEQALLVQEAQPGPERRSASASARRRLSRVGRNGLNVRRVLKAEARANWLMAQDAGSLGAWAYALRINAVAWIGRRAF